MAIIEALIARRFDGPLPELSPDTMIYEWSTQLEKLPLVETLPLHGRALFAAGSLEATARRYALFAQPAFFAELGAAVGVSARVLHAAVRARRFPLEPPRLILDYEYLGNFSSGGKLDIADPCHLRKSSRLPPSAFSLSHAIEAPSGTWHAYARNGRGDAANRTAELVVIHERGFDTAASEKITSIGVDAGIAGVFDRACPIVDTDSLGIEGIVNGLGVYTRSGYGDGMYPVFAGRHQGQVVKLRLAFLDEKPQSDVSMPVRQSRRYAVSETFAVGDAVEHPKFGIGVVTRVAGNKIDVDFDGELRTLIHGRR